MTTKEHRARRACNARPLVLFGGEKGGQGKSFKARVAAWRLSAMGAAVELFDGDERNAHLERYYGRRLAVTRFDARSETGWTSFFNALDDVPAEKVVLVDLPAGAGSQLHREINRLRSNEVLGMPTVHVWVADPSEDSVRLFKDLAGIAPASRTAFVMNQIENGDVSRFQIWLNSQTRASFLAEGGIEVTLPRLSVRLHDRIAAGQLPFPDDRPPEWARGDWFTFAEFRSAVDEGLKPLFTLIEELRP